MRKLILLLIPLIVLLGCQSGTAPPPVSASPSLLRQCYARIVTDPSANAETLVPQFYRAASECGGTEADLLRFAQIEKDI